MKIQIEIEINNAAFEAQEDEDVNYLRFSWSEVRYVLNQAEKLTDPEYDNVGLYDSYGNRVGLAKFVR